VVDVGPVYSTYAHLLLNWNIADGPSHKRAVFIQMMIAFCHGESTQPLHVYLLKRLLFVKFAQTHDDGQHGWVAFIADALRFICGRRATGGSGCDLRGILYPGELLFERGDELLRLFQRKQLPRPVWHILTDIDDTIFAHPDWASVAGCDRSWDAYEPYPGIIQFYKRFYATLHPMFRYSTVLSATPSICKDARSRDQVIRRVLTQSDIDFGFLHGFDSAVPYLTSQRHERFGLEKYKKFRQYIDLFPEHRVLFIGDDGQGDVVAGRLMRTSHPDKCHVFIHRLSVDQRTYTTRSGAHHHNADDSALHVHYFRDYAELAVLFQHVLHIFTEDDVDAIRTDMCALVAESSTTSAEKRRRNQNLYAEYCKTSSCVRAEHGIPDF
jgi:hypothetical protein